MSPACRSASSIHFIPSLIQHAGESHQNCWTVDLDNKPVPELCWHQPAVWHDTQQAVGKGLFLQRLHPTLMTLEDESFFQLLWCLLHFEPFMLSFHGVGFSSAWADASASINQNNRGMKGKCGLWNAALKWVIYCVDLSGKQSRCLESLKCGAAFLRETDLRSMKMCSSSWLKRRK